MARVTLSDDLKKAITSLSAKEKDKLLFRLIALKPELAAQLEFQLLEGGETQEERRRDVELSIEKSLTRYEFYSPGYLMLQLRDLSGEITRHVKTTKDKYGDVYLNFKLLSLALELYGAECAKARSDKQTNFNMYVLKKAEKALSLMLKLDPDYHLDFKSMRNQIGNVMSKNPVLLKDAEQCDFDLDWLLSTEATPRSLG